MKKKMNVFSTNHLYGGCCHLLYLLTVLKGTPVNTAVTAWNGIFHLHPLSCQVFVAATEQEYLWILQNYRSLLGSSYNVLHQSLKVWSTKCRNQCNNLRNEVIHRENLSSMKCKNIYLWSIKKTYNPQSA